MSLAVKTIPAVYKSVDKVRFQANGSVHQFIEWMNDGMHGPCEVYECFQLRGGGGACDWCRKLNGKEPLR